MILSIGMMLASNIKIVMLVFRDMSSFEPSRDFEISYFKDTKSVTKEHF